MPVRHSSQATHAPGRDGEPGAGSPATRAINLSAVTIQRSLRHNGLIESLPPDIAFRGVVRPTVGRLERLGIATRHVHPDRSTWRARDSFNPWMFAALSRSLERELRTASTQPDVLLYLYPILFRTPAPIPTILYLDTTVEVTRREYPEWLGLTRRGWRSAIERERDVLRSAAAVFMEGSVGAASAVDDYGCDPEKVVNVGPAPAMPTPPHFQPRGDDLGDDVLFVGTRFEQRKGGETLLDAWGIVTSALPSATLHVVTHSEAPAGLPQSIRWHRNIPADDLQGLFRRSRVYVHPAPYESCVPNAIREAMAFGLPVIASDVRTYVHELPPSVRLVPVGAAGKLAEHVVTLLSDRDASEHEGRANQEHSATHFRWDTSTAALAEHVRRAVGREHSPLP